MRSTLREILRLSGEVWSLHVKSRADHHFINFDVSTNEKRPKPKSGIFLVNIFYREWSSSSVKQGPKHAALVKDNEDTYLLERRPDVPLLKVLKFPGKRKCKRRNWRINIQKLVWNSQMENISFRGTEEYLANCAPFRNDTEVRS